MQKIGSYIRLLRPHEWVKNGFVYTGVFFGHHWQDLHLIMQATMLAIAFSFVASSIYVFNDIVDRDKDRLHPKKKYRPIASGEVSIFEGVILGAIIGVMGFVLGIMTSWYAVIILASYALLNVAYSLRLKQIVLIDVFCISTGFLLRILAGTKGLDIPPSKWLFLCGLMITLFLGFAKRRAEVVALAGKKGEHRRVLELYSTNFLDEITAVCVTGVIVSYSLYAMDAETIRIHNSKSLIYTVPIVVYALFRYLFLLHHKQGGGDPSRDLIKDPHIVLAVVGWTVMTIGIIIF